ncbi:DNA internalization-related competence protein ComEC/Rec2 [Streptococcus chenjunshii]|uniref:DNA internalization-related competence protein ComEC/Rec2 n=1 Tax=Streptococcus chenjunshii TaxID=2173853 RepID=A0A372KM95_9STRE|nr:DNA internalization-related competence protein ComEC/Rec2 [Streptococcus chenjunshii]AXQ78267.1 DNA internalization-related competence protein ComEC/Rec2 [Streptococcus chenjunshii]RFU50446.1 DNA internalization-related competence protein ComEC/Rec2 [Streptococcus chenjunshii]RFU52698.1 DNA internalization-related competence protein ComEC/Rec2 [Streptococcus chenjunshii]
MINGYPIKLIHLAFLLLLLYFWFFSATILGLFLFAFALICLFRQYSWQKALLAMLILAAFAVYFGFWQKRQEKAYQEAPAAIRYIELVSDSIAVNGDLLSFQGKSDGRKYQVFYRFQSKEEKDFFNSLSDTVILQVEGEIAEAETVRNFDGFDYRSYLKNQGIYRLIELKNIQQFRQLSSKTPLHYLQEWRRKAVIFIQHHFPAPMRYYMTGLLFGYLDKSFDEMADLYTSLGIIHLFALSGMHVGFFVRLFRFCFLRLGMRRDYVDYLQIPFSFLYAALTGFSVSVMRSLVQNGFSNLGIKGVDNFALTLMTFFLIMPHFLLIRSGILSFAYAFILILIDFSSLGRYQRKLAESLTLAIGILPLVLYFFSVFQPLSVFFTIFFSLTFEFLFLPLLTVIFLLSPFIKITFVNSLFVLLESIINQLSQFFSRPLVLGQPQLPILILLFILLGLLYDFYHRKKLALLLTLPIALLFFSSKLPLENEITMIDVGQGDSIFLRDMQGKTILIDVGGRPVFTNKESWQKRWGKSNAEKTLIPYLRSRGVSKIDQLVLTHADTDHVGDLQVLAKYFKIGEILISPGSLTQNDFVQTLKAMKTEVRTVKAGDSLSIMQSRLYVLHPYQTGDGSNNDSIVLYGYLLNQSFLFTGDLEKEGEEKLMQLYSRLPVDVLKVGHHGSKGSTSSEFLSFIKPRYALISAGVGNRYQHPHQETLNRLKAVSVKIYRTDLQGGIRFRGWNSWQTETVK